MRYINTLVEGETIRNIYLCKGKRSAETRNGKPYDNLILQDKTGTLDGKVWDPNSNGITICSSISVRSVRRMKMSMWQQTTCRQPRKAQTVCLKN